MGTVLVVGGTGGVGSSVVQTFAREGHDVVFTYLKAEDTAEKLTHDCAQYPGAVTARRLDVRDDDAVTDVVRSCEAALHHVVFAAASGILKPLADVKRKHWDWTFDVNVRAFGLLFRDTLAPLAAHGGTLTAMTALGSRRVMPAYAIVGAAKAAIENVVRYAAVEAGPHAVRVNAVCPGVIETKALDHFPEHGRRMVSEATARTPLGRLVTTQEVADLVLWLTGDSARMITGQAIVIDGGWELNGPPS
jgi:enoyl-[acyl-carrier protein] reductase III